MKPVLYLCQFIGLLVIGAGAYHIYKARQIQGLGGLGAGFLGIAEAGFGALIIIVSAIVYWIQKWRRNRRQEK